MFYPYHWPNGLKELPSGIAHKEWKCYQGIIHNTHHGENIETNPQVICFITGDVVKPLEFPNFATPVTGTSREVLDNDTATRDKSYLNGSGMKKVESVGLSMNI